MQNQIETLKAAIENWNTENVTDLRDAIRALNAALAEAGDVRKVGDLVDMAALPSAEIPDDIDTGYPVWACDKAGRCLVGTVADEIETLDQIRE